MKTDSHKVGNRLYDLYRNTIVDKMVKHFNYENVYQTPKIVKIVLSMGVKKDDITIAKNDLKRIAGQEPIITKAKKSIAQFAIREGFEVGVKVTLRDKQVMYNFLDRLSNIALLRWRSFNGLKAASFNKQKSNISISIGVNDTRIFHEVKSDSIKNRGCNITICTNANNTEEAKFLLESFGLPFKG